MSTADPTPPSTPTSPAANDPLAQTVTSTNSKWLIKIGLICAMFAGLGIWGLIDALIVYPKRGLRAADFFEYQHLTAAKAKSSLSDALAGIADPAKTWATLDAKQKEGAALSPDEKAQHDWLEQLRYVGRLKPEATTYPRSVPGAGDQSASARFDALKQQFTTAAGGAVKAPSPLSAFDIPSQWGICAVGFAIAGWLALTMLRVKGTRYRWESASRTLTLPGGQTLGPTDIAEFDKSEWDKVFIKLKIREGHPSLAGKTLRLDLLRHVPLEAWILEMEKSVSPASPQ